jgi:hypothetical protein
MKIVLHLLDGVNKRRLIFWYMLVTCRFTVEISWNMNSSGRYKEKNDYDGSLFPLHSCISLKLQKKKKSSVKF